MKKYILLVVLAVFVSISAHVIGTMDAFLSDIVSVQVNIDTAIINNSIEVRNINFIHSTTNEAVTEFSNGHVITVSFEVNNPTKYDVIFNGDVKMAFHTEGLIVNNTFFIYDDSYDVASVRYDVFKEMAENALLGFTTMEQAYVTNTYVGERLGTKTRFTSDNQLAGNSSVTFTYKIFYSNNIYVQNKLMSLGVIPLEFIVDVEATLDNQEIQNSSSYHVLNTLALEHANPTIVLNGDEEMTICLYDNFIDHGARAWNSFGREISVIPTGTVVTNYPGEYRIIYTATDAYGLTASIERKVIVLDTVCEHP